MLIGEHRGKQNFYTPFHIFSRLFFEIIKKINSFKYYRFLENKRKRSIGSRRTRAKSIAILMRELSQAANTGDIICELYEPSTTKEFRAEASPALYVSKITREAGKVAINVFYRYETSLCS